MSRLIVAVVLTLAAVAVTAQSAIEYRLRFPEPEHRWMQVEVTFPEVPRDRALELRMSRSSPGRYALHEFVKNVFEVRAYDSRGRELALERPSAYQWNVAGHDGTVRVVYNVYGDHVDGTYVAVDTTHAHVNMPASLLWARGLHDRPARVTFEIPEQPGWTVATQLYPTGDPVTFTAPNFQYLMDSPAEVGPLTIRDFVTKGPDGAPARFRIALHHDGSEADASALAADVEKVAREEAAIFGEFPAYEPGGYTFLLDYLPYAGGDGMEHRNSTVITSRLSTSSASERRTALNTIAHELFHGWNVERIRPRSLEPFDFEQANTSGELWLAEGFTTYYAALVLQRAGLATLDETVHGFGLIIDAVVNAPGRRVRSAVDASRMAPFVDAARSVDRTNFSNTSISYYTFGAAIGLGLDLTLRDRSDGRVTLDDYMRALWRAYGRPGGPAPGLVARPYTLADLRDRLADVSGDRATADDFFNRFIEGREVVDYARLAGRAGLLLRKRRPRHAWIGALGLERAGGAVKIDRLVPFGSPAYAAGLEQDDVVVSVGGRAVASPRRRRRRARRAQARRSPRHRLRAPRKEDERDRDPCRRSRARAGHARARGRHDHRCPTIVPHSLARHVTLKAVDGAHGARRPRGRGGSRFHSKRIGGPMLADLIPQVLVNRAERLGVRRPDTQPRARPARLTLVSDLAREPRHRRRARGTLGMDPLGRGEVSRRERRLDLFDVAADTVARVAVGGIEGFDRDGAAVREQPKVMAGLALIEAHGLGAAPLQGGVVMLHRKK
jgi:predicted metalloprotease with PDZ domain